MTDGVSLLDFLTDEARDRALQYVVAFSALGDEEDAERAERWLAAIGSFAHEAVRSMMHDIERRVLTPTVELPGDTPERARTRAMGVAIYLTTSALDGFVAGLLRDAASGTNFEPMEKDCIDQLAALLRDSESWKKGD